MKGQYFSFDAVVATVIMVVAITSLAAYWFGVQSVIESHNNPMYADSLRIAESLLSPGSPSNWTLYATGFPADLNMVKQIGLGNDFGNELDRNKIEKLKLLADPSLGGNYLEVGRLFRANGEYYIKIEQTDDSSVPGYYIGKAPLANATEVVIAHRGGTMEDSHHNLQPMRIAVYLWRQ